MRISWNPPAPRAGLAGMWDRFVGPGLTTAETWLVVGGTLGLTTVIGLLSVVRQPLLNWTALQIGVALLLAFDLGGGIVTNALSGCKRWYHRPGQGWRAHLGFVALHALHPALVAWLFLNGDWLYFLVAYGFLLVTAVIILRAPLYLQRPLALLIYAVALLMAFYLLPTPAGLEWFLPFLYLKLLVAHILPETPFQPGDRMA